MKEWITSDLHFGHVNIKNFCPATRSHYRDVSHMNSEMIRMWNDLICDDDVVYILGDVCFMRLDDAVATVRELKGKKILIEGNHDQKLLKNSEFRSCFAEIHKYLDINRNGVKIVMFHYPIAEWDQQYRGSVHFHGHLHGKPSGIERYRARDVSIDATGQIAVTLEEATADALRGIVKTN
jgi:calcineurin-like phosphoesterase family protein